MHDTLKYCVIGLVGAIMGFVIVLAHMKINTLINYIECVAVQRDHMDEELFALQCQLYAFTNQAYEGAVWAAKTELTSMSQEEIYRHADKIYPAFKPYIDQYYMDLNPGDWNVEMGIADQTYWWIQSLIDVSCEIPPRDIERNPDDFPNVTGPADRPADQ